MGEVHEPGVYEPAVEVVEAIAGFDAYRFLELCEGIVYLVEHHHAIASVSIVLCILIVKADGCTKVVHGLLVVTDGHKGITSVSVIFCMS